MHEPHHDLVVRFRTLQDRLRDPLLTALAVILVLLVFVIAPLHAADILHSQGYGIALALLIAGAVLLMSGSLVAVAAMLIAIGFAIAAVAVQGHDDAKPDVLLNVIAWLILGCALLWVVARTVFAPGAITYHRVVGAVLLYLTIGLVFVGVFAAISLVLPAGFSGIKASDGHGLASQLIYFSFVTLTSTGYGDIVPVHPLTRSLCNLESIIGQLYPATLLARLVTLELENRQRRAN